MACSESARGGGERRLPRPLGAGETIGFFSPSAPATAFARERFERGRAFLEGKGYRLKAGSLTGRSDGYRSGTAEERAEELNALLRDPEVRCVMSTIGGHNSNGLLRHVDYEALAADPKPVVGYSDVTALLLGIYARTGLTTFYGPALVASFGEFPPLVEETFASFRTVVGGAAGPGLRYEPPERWTEEWIEWSRQDRAKRTRPNRWRFHGSGVARGRLMGGNLATLQGIMGSPFMPRFQKGDILLIENSGLTIAEEERGLWLLELNGAFDQASAILLGKHERFDGQGTGRTPFAALREVMGERRTPVVEGFDCCHTHPMLTVPIGAELEIDFDAQRVTLVGSATR